MKSKKGLAISINTLVMIIIALVVLLVVSGYFLGGFSAAAGGMGNISKGAKGAVKTPAEYTTDIEGAAKSFSPLKIPQMGGSVLCGQEKESL